MQGSRPCYSAPARKLTFSNFGKTGRAARVELTPLIVEDFSRPSVRSDTMWSITSLNLRPSRMGAEKLFLKLALARAATLNDG